MSVSIEYVQTRLADAAETLRAIPVPRGPAEPRNSWPDFIRSYAEAYDSDAKRAELEAGAAGQAIATPKQITEMEQALAWPAWPALIPPRFVWARAGGCPWWRLELRRWRLRRWRRRYPKETLQFFYRADLTLIAKKIEKGFWGF